MVEYSIRPATYEDALFLAPRLRQSDVDEMWAGYHLEPHLGLALSLAVSRDTSYTGCADGKPVILFGVALPSLLIPAGRPWMVGTDELTQHSRAFLRMSRDHVKENMSQKFPYLYNFVDARHDAAIQWLVWLGFKIHAAEPFGPDDMPFHRFTMGAF